MAEVLFYHLEVRPLESVLPQLLEKTLERGWRAIVETGSRERAEALESLLWTYRDDAFLPHGLAGEASEGHQPILLTTESTENPNGAVVRFFVDRAVPQSADGYRRIVPRLAAHPPAGVAGPPPPPRALREGNEITYWQQEQDSRWVKKA